MFGEADQSKDDEYFGARIAAVGRFQFGLAHEIASKISLKENVTSYYYNGLLKLISEKNVAPEHEKNNSTCTKREICTSRRRGLGTAAKRSEGCEPGSAYCGARAHLHGQ